MVGLARADCSGWLASTTPLRRDAAHLPERYRRARRPQPASLDAGALFWRDQWRLRQSDCWLPPYYIQLGKSAQFSGTLLALMTVGQTAGALILPMLAHHQDRRKLLLFTLALQMLGFCGFILWPAQLPILWAVVCGIGLAARFLYVWCWRSTMPDIR